MALITKTKNWADNDNVLYTDINANFDALYNEFNGNIDNANIKSGAGIDVTKISGTALNLTSTQTVSGQKTFIKPILNAVQNVVTDADATTITFDMSASNVHVVTLSGNRTLAVSNVSVGQYFSIELIQDGTGGRSVTWFSTIKWQNSVVPTLLASAGNKDTFVFRCTGTNTYDGYIVGQNVG